MCQHFGAGDTGEYKKRPLPEGQGPFAGFYAGKINLRSATARAGITGARTAAATITDRVGGGDRETRTIPGFDKIYLYVSAGRKQVFFNQKG